MWVEANLFLILLIIMLSFNVNPAVGLDKAPDFTLMDINGNPFTLSDQLDKVVLIDFFGTRCPRCDIELEELKVLYNRYPPDKFIIVSISVYGTDEEVRNYAQKHDMLWTVARDTSPSVSDRYNVYPLPTLFIIDAEGYIRNKYEIFAEASVLSSKIDSLLSGTENSDSDGNSGTGQTGPSYTLIAIIGGAVAVCLVIGLVVKGQLLGWSEPSKKRGSPKGKH